jgi:hypothetical protein
MSSQTMAERHEADAEEIARLRARVQELEATIARLEAALKARGGDGESVVTSPQAR